MTHHFEELVLRLIQPPQARPRRGEFTAAAVELALQFLGPAPQVALGAVETPVKLDPRIDLPGLDRLLNVIGAAAVERLRQIPVVLRRRQEHDRNLLQLRMHSHPLAYFESADLRHQHVQNHHIRRPLHRRLQCVGAVAKRPDAVARVSQYPFEQIEVIPIVINDDDIVAGGFHLPGNRIHVQLIDAAAKLTSGKG
ncbi:MAG: hypothetical protein R2729_32845 [Bryobacteraceae bacterium]